MRKLTLMLLLLTASPLAAQLGTIDFPTSGNAAARPAFERGVLLLHSFEYDDAARSFREAQQADPGFAMAYWGEALTYTHPLWNQQDLAAARAALERLAPSPEARRNRAGTEREKRYMDAIEALYGGSGSKATRDTLYSSAMERLIAAFPDDQEAQTFYALSLMGLSQGIRVVPTYMKAGAIAQEVYRRNPQHPGALHYIIHAFDDPTHAPLGLRAAYEYSKIAGDAPHAQHMTTHIFLAMGMWPETVNQNIVASGDSATWSPGHYTYWMTYGLLQQGKAAVAEAVLARTRQNMAPRQAGALIQMRAHYLINSGRWTDSVAAWPIPMANVGAQMRLLDSYIAAVGSLERKQGTAIAAGVLHQLDSAAAREALVKLPGIPSPLPALLAKQLAARLELSRGKQEAAITLLRAAAAIEDTMAVEFGPPIAPKPSHELLGEALLAARRPAEAKLAFQRSLELAPGRSLSLLGLSRAARATGDNAVADRAIASLAGNWYAADPDTPGLNEARQTRAGAP
jgi:tetratricopeptide (TPR) repeat protein